jgi:hypothetical protein
MPGLSLTSGKAERVDAAHIVTLAQGTNRGRVWEIQKVTAGSRVDMRPGTELDPEDEIAAPSGDGGWLRYSLQAIDDGLYMAENTGGDAMVYFEVTAGEVRRIYDDEQHVKRELRRR